MSDYDEFKDCVEVLERFLETLKPKANAYYSIAYLVAKMGREQLEIWDARRDE